MQKMRFFEVGGCVRDTFLGRDSKDIDFTVEVESFDAMRTGLRERGFEIFVESPEFFTIRARHPQNRQTFDFVMARKEGNYKDGRRPSSVERGTIFDDLARRDFTINAIAKAEDGVIIDPHNGRDDIEARIIRAVGNANERFSEDGLRILRAIRFAVTLGFSIDDDTFNAMVQNRDNIRRVSVERIREELEKAFRADTVATFRWIERIGASHIVFSNGLRASATLRG
jgi:tRNA nucleotidyltransferase (CCA-adding enzyme)